MTAITTYPQHATLRRSAASASSRIRDARLQSDLCWFFFLGCLIAFALVALAFLWSPQPFIGEGGLKMISLKTSFSGAASREAFLEKLTERQLTEIAGHTHYISQLIKHTTQDQNTHENKKLAMAIVIESVKANYDPLFVAAVIKAESTFRHSAISVKGAQGLMQLQPETGLYISERNGVEWQGRRGLNDPQYNLKLGIAYLKYLERSFNGDKRLALVAYNWGPGNLLNALKNQSPIPQKTLDYASKIMSYRNQWRNELDSRMAHYRFMNIDSILS
jgi:hypothetical protein